MRRLILALGASFVLAGPAHAFQLPQLSPNASVTQVVGITEVGIRYASPAVRERTIFGGLVPYDKMWRAGANGTTTLSFSSEVTIAGQNLPAGEYSLFFIPSASSWTVVINADPRAQLGSGSYDSTKDVVRFEVKPERITKRERLTYIFSDTQDAGTRIDMEWDTVRVSIPLSIQTAAGVERAIEGLKQQQWGPLSQSASYYLNLKEYDKALALANASTAIHETWQNLWVKAQILKGQKKNKDALQTAKKAYELGKKDSYFYFKTPIEKALKDWK